MLGLNIQTNDEALDAIVEIEADIDLDHIAPIIGRSGVQVVQDHFTQLDATRRNRLGGRRTHFYAAAARSTNFRITANGVQVAINHVGIAQRYYGGTIKPVNAKLLTIPAAAEAYGKRAREFGKLDVVFGRQGVVGLAKPGRPGQKARSRPGKILYWLVKSVTQSADKTVLPTDKEITAHIAGDVQAHLADQEKRRHQ